MLIATLIAANRLTQTDCERAAKLLASAGLAAGAPSWIDPDSAADMLIDGDDLAAARTALAPLTEQIDVLVRSAANPPISLLISDMDSTMIGQECIDELADYAGVKDQIAGVTARAMAGELDFAQSLRERVALLKGLSEHAISQCLAERIRPSPGARTLIATAHSHGITCLLVSGGFHAFADVVGADLGFNGVFANRLEIDHGHLTGRLIGDLLDADAKRAILAREVAAAGIAPAATLALGDGANDIPMLEAAGFGLACHAKPAAIAAADGTLRHNDLSAALYLLKIARKDWVGAD